MVDLKLHQPVYGGKPGDTVSVSEEKVRLAEHRGWGKRAVLGEHSTPVQVSEGYGDTPNGASASGRLTETWERVPGETGDAIGQPVEPEQELDPNAT